MNNTTIGRRDLLKFLGATAALSAIPRTLRSMPAPAADRNFTYCLNMATIREQKLGFVKELETASKAGFDAVEIWMDTLQAYLDKGGKLSDIRKRLKDMNLTVAGAIGFAAWIVDDDSERNKAVEQLKKEMDMLAEIGCTRTAAPPAGATEKPGLDLRKAAERYRAILELGDKTGVTPHLELWGFSANLNRLGDVMFVAIESGHPKAKVLLDNYHLYKGGSSVSTLKMLNPLSTDLFHVNDYPANMSRSQITDADRTYPGDGVSPIREVLNTLKSEARPLIISLEVFNKQYYRQDAFEVARTGLAKMKKVAQDVAKMDR